MQGHTATVCSREYAGTANLSNRSKRNQRLKYSHLRGLRPRSTGSVRMPIDTPSALSDPSGQHDSHRAAASMAIHLGGFLCF